jgi:muconate cycloisomerase
MKISEIEVIPFSLPYKTPFRMSTGIIHTADNVLVKIFADNGLVGLGETQPVPGMQGCTETQASICEVINTHCSPLLEGQEPRDIDKIMESLESVMLDSRYAMAAVCNGLYDLLAKSLNIPLYDLLGGLYRGQIEMVWPIGIQPTTEVEQEVQLAKKKGYRKIKIKVGSPDRDEDIEHISAAQSLGGKEFSLRIDANGCYSFSEALHIIQAVNMDSLDLIEQPLPFWDIDGLAKLSNLIDIPIMADESCHSVQSALELAKKKAVSIFDIKLEKNGGIHNASKIAAIAQAANISLYAGGNPGSSISAATSVHFFAALPNVMGGDFNVGQAKSLSGDIAAKPLELKEPFVLVPNGPGIGIDLDEKKLAKYAVSTVTRQTGKKNLATKRTKMSIRRKKGAKKP